MSFTMDIVPSEAHRRSGYLRASGVVPLDLGQPAQTASEDGGTAAAPAAGTGSTAAIQPATRREQLDMRLAVRDGGMAILTSVSPDLAWKGGSADIMFRCWRLSGLSATSAPTPRCTHGGARILSSRSCLTLPLRS